VVAQPLAWLSGWSLLPPFDAWQSGAVPYGWLFASQVALLALMARAAWRVASGVARPSPRRGAALLGAAACYGAVMAVRLVAGATWLRGHWWFDAPLPTVFHLGLAAYLGVYAHYHWRGTPRVTP
jgi:hypothetical protein